MNATCAAGTETELVATRVPGGIGFIACQNAVPTHAAAIASSAILHSTRERDALEMGRLPAAT